MTNFAVWATMGIYPLTASGLALCYYKAIPYFWNTLLGDLGFVTIFFGGLAWLEHRVAWMREVPAPVAA